MRKLRKPRKAKRTNAQIKAQKRGFAKFRLAGVKATLGEIIRNIPLTSNEKRELGSALTYINRSLNSWSDFKNRLKR